MSENVLEASYHVGRYEVRFRLGEDNFVADAGPRVHDGESAGVVHWQDKVQRVYFHDVRLSW